MYGRNATENWIPIASRVQNTTYTHTGLIAGVSYFFVVRAENSHGMSAPSPLSEPIVLGIVSLILNFIFIVFSLVDLDAAAAAAAAMAMARGARVTMENLNYSISPAIIQFRNFRK